MSYLREYYERVLREFGSGDDGEKRTARVELRAARGPTNYNI